MAKAGIREEADIKLDIDNRDIYADEKLSFRFGYLFRYFGDDLGSFVCIDKYKTKKGYHYYIKFPAKKEDLSRIDMVMIQLILGSDWLRELRNLYRISKDDKTFNVLFSTKVKDGKIQNEEYIKTMVITSKGIIS